MEQKNKKSDVYFFPGWETEMEEFNLMCTNSEKVYVCSPLGAETVPEIYENMHHAREYMFMAMQVFNCVPVAPHAYLPVLLNDTVADERNLGLKFGVELLSVCQHIFVCGPTISAGMAAEIKYAAREGISIHLFNELLRGKVEELCEGTNAKLNYHFGGDFVPLAVPSPKKYFNDKECFLRGLFK